MEISQLFLSSQIPAFFRRAGYAQGLILFKDGRVRNLRKSDRGAQALVYDLDGRPFRTEIAYTPKGFEWTCECPSLRPCPHAAALLLELENQDFLPPDWEFPKVDELDGEGNDELSNEPESDRAQDIPKDPTSQMSLFTDELLSTLHSNPFHPFSSTKSRRSQGQRAEPKESLGLFDQPPPPFRPIPADARHLGFSLVTHQEGLILEPVLMGRNPEEDGFYPYKEGILKRRLPEAVEIILDLLVKSEAQGTKVGVHDLIRLFDTLELAEEDQYRGLRLPVHWPGNSIPAKVVKVAQLTLRLIRDDGDDSIYFPMLVWNFDYGGRPLTLRGAFTFWDEDGQFYWYEKDRNWLIYGESWYREIRFLRSFFGSGNLVVSRERVLEIETALEGIGGIDLEISGEDEGIICPMPRIIVSLQGNNRGTEVYLSFRYRSWEPSYQEKALRFQISGPGEKLLLIQRNLDAEASLVHDLVRILGDLVVYERGYYAAAITGNREADLQIRLPINDFLHVQAGQLMAQGVEIRVEKRKVRIAKELRFAIQQNMDWFGVKAEVEVDDTGDGLPGGALSTGWSMSRGTGQVGPDQLSIDEGLKNYGMVVRGAEYVLLGQKDLRRLEYLRRQGMTEDGALQSSAANLVLIDAIYENARVAEEGAEIDWSGRRHALEVLKDHDLLPRVSVPQGLQAQLRAYQHKGLDWLVYMHENNLNPCLADDMGLGKTLQTIALLLFMRERGVTGPFLLIAPVVTLGNWEAEVERFAPSMQVLRHSGADRTQDADHFARADLVLVSYHTLRNDVDLFLDQEFTYLILDEAHSIKNYYSQVFKAVRSLRSLHRLSLTGTPIENTLMELWSQMNFLNPGLLGTAKEFYNRYFLPIEKQGDQGVLDELKELVGPLILRRTKGQVLDDLPAKEVIVHYCEMDEVQAGYYTQQRDQFRDQILGIFEEPEEDSETTDETDLAPKKPAHRGKATIEIFRFLLKLRQLAIHPPIAGPEYHRVPSAKMEGLLLLLEEILTENHKVLIFSQFLGSLEAIGQECRRRSWGFALLTGATQDRTAEIQRFQEDGDTRIFLLSLKAGGVGINLTAADYVILFDPWWNPAAEKQAIDRAHRMGQKKNVIAYKLIVRGTIEEKILQLQERKHALAEEIIAEGRGILANLPRDEVVNLFQ